MDQRHAPAALYPQERPGTHCTGGWVGPRAFGEGCKYINKRQITIADCWKRKHKYRQSILGISSNNHGTLERNLGNSNKLIENWKVL